MEDKWKQKFNEKFSGFQREIPVPPFESLPQKRHRGAVVRFAAVAAAAAAAVLALLFLARPSSPETPLLAYSIQEKESQISISLERPGALITSRSISTFSNETSTQEYQPATKEKEAVEETTVYNPPEDGQLKRATRTDSEYHIQQDRTDQEFKENNPTKLSLQLKGSSLIRMSFYKTRHQPAVGGMTDTTIDTTTNAICPPIRIGFSINYQLTPKWSLESGLNYLFYLSGNNNSNAGAEYEIITNSLHYIGLPLSFNYKLFDHNRLHYYVSGGGEVAFCLNESNIMVSTLASFGIDYQIKPEISIFAEPGMMLQIYNSSYSVYKHPLFDISFGIRFSTN